MVKNELISCNKFECILKSGQTKLMPGLGDSWKTHTQNVASPQFWCKSKSV